MATKLWCTGEIGRSSHSPSTQILMWMLPACRDTYIPIGFCGGRILLVLEVTVEEEASLAQLWEHIKLQYLQITLWIKSLVPSVYNCVTGAKVCTPPGLGRMYLSAITKVLFKRKKVLPSWIRLDGPDCVLAKMAPPWALLDLISKHKCAMISGLSPVLNLQRKISTTRLGDGEQEQ